MPDESRYQRRLDQLRDWRNPKPRDLSLRFMQDQFDKKIARPHRQMGALAKLWQQLLPPALVERTALDGFARGVLSVQVADSSTLYEIDRLLRGGLEMQLQQTSRTALKKVRLSVNSKLFSPPV
jgi:hypothetical protein